jgi:hypothetical protein
MKLGGPPELGAEARAVIAAARDAHQPNELSRARVRRGVEIKLAAAGLGLLVAPATSALAGALKVTLVAVAVGSTMVGGYYAVPQVLRRHAHVHAPAAHHEIARAPIAPAPVAPAIAPADLTVADLEPPTEAPPPAMVRVHHRPRVAPAVETNPDASDLAGETALLSAANAALARHDVAHAAVLLSAYDRQRAPSLLGEEREATGILVACAAGRPGAARTAAVRFRTRWPRSPLLARVESSCAGRVVSEP